MAQRSYRGQSVAERSAERRERLMTAALEVFGTLGYAGGTVSAICSAAGLSRRQFYELFETREDLLIAVYDMIHREARAAVLAAFASVDRPDPPLEERVRPAVAAFFDSVAADPRRMRIAFIEVGGISTRVEAHRFEARREWMTFFSAAASEFTDLPDSEFGFDYEAMIVIGALTEAGHLWAKSDPRPNRDTVVSMLMSVILALAASRSPASRA